MCLIIELTGVFVRTLRFLSKHMEHITHFVEQHRRCVLFHAVGVHAGLLFIITIAIYYYYYYFVEQHRRCELFHAVGVHAGQAGAEIVPDHFGYTFVMHANVHTAPSPCMQHAFYTWSAS